MDTTQFHRFDDRADRRIRDLLDRVLSRPNSGDIADYEKDLVGWVEGKVRFMPPVRVKKLPNFVGPKKDGEPIPQDKLLKPAHEDDAGIDIFAAEKIVLPPGQRVTVPTGLAMAISKDFYAAVSPKSGLSHSGGITVLNTPGTVDAPYRGEIGVILFNSNPIITHALVDLLLDAIDGSEEVAKVNELFSFHYEENTKVFAPGDKVAQIIFKRYYRPEIQWVDDLDETSRGDGAFGSTGK